MSLLGALAFITVESFVTAFVYVSLFHLLLVVASLLIPGPIVGGFVCGLVLGIIISLMPVRIVKESHLDLLLVLMLTI